MQRILAGAPEECHDRSGTPCLTGALRGCRTWGQVAWADLLGELPAEPAAAEADAAAGEEFQRKLSAALTEQLPLRVDRRNKKGEPEEKERELRAVIDWCYQLAKEGDWASVRSWRVWCRLAPGEGTRMARLRVAFHVELITQVKARDLAALKQRELASLCELYDLGRRVRVGHGGRWAVELSPDYVADLLAGHTRVEDRV
jgi:hypothetical protein